MQMTANTHTHTHITDRHNMGSRTDVWRHDGTGAIDMHSDLQHSSPLNMADVVMCPCVACCRTCLLFLPLGICTEYVGEILVMLLEYIFAGGGRDECAQIVGITREEEHVAG